MEADKVKIISNPGLKRVRENTLDLWIGNNIFHKTNDRQRPPSPWRSAAANEARPQCTSLLDPPRARFPPKSLVNARWKRAPARTLGVFARIPSKTLCCLPNFGRSRRPRGVINSVKQRLSHPLSRIKPIDQWAADPDPFLTLTTSAKIGKTAIGLCNTPLFEGRVVVKRKDTP